MAKTPVADIVATIKNGDGVMFIPIGVLWKSNKGNLSGTIDSEPVQWVPGQPRHVSVRTRPGVRIEVVCDDPSYE